MAKTKARVDGRTIVLLHAVAKATDALHIEWMVTGAAGRVMLLEGVYGLPHGRATQDVDLGVMVANWKQYQALVERIRQDTRFQPDPKQRQRLRFRDDGILDLIPFGDIEANDRTIHWPPDNDFTMSVIGFREAYADAVKVSIDGLSVAVVSPVGLMLLKLVAWQERHHAQPKKDAADIAYLLRHYSAALTEKVLFDDHFTVMEATGFDVDLAASRVLGQKMVTLAENDARDYMRNFLDHELKERADSILVREIGEHLAGAGKERAYQLLSGLRAGLDEVVKE